MTKYRPLIYVGMLLAALTWAHRTDAADVEFQTVPRRPAPSLDGGGQWINSAAPLRLPELRGKFVILDFWTYCCINCLQTLPDLKQLEQAYPKELVVIGVHSPKFFGERDTDNIRAAVIRHGVDHPVVNDANLVIARKYGVNGWPSLRVIDPQGFLIAKHGGEATFEMMDRYMRRILPRYRRVRAIDETLLRFDLDRTVMPPTPLRFPGKVLADPKGRLFIADSGNNRIVIASHDGTLLDVVGSGQYGRQNGSYEEASFAHPQGMALDGDVLYVADTENHLLRQIDLSSKRVSTVAGTGLQAHEIVIRASGRPTATRLASPWDLWKHGDSLYIAMAGTHQIWKMTLGRRSRLQLYAGNGIEDIVDGPLRPRTPFQKGFASFAQPSGFSSDGRYLFVADSEGSSIRSVPFRASDNVTTILGTSRLPDARLFTFGDRDGPLGRALLQHPLAVVYWRDRLFVADTYNNKIKEIDLRGKLIRTIAGDSQAGDSNRPPRFDEPAGLGLHQETLYVADTNNHKIKRINLAENYAVTTLEIKGLEPPQPTQANPSPLLPSAEKITFGTVEVRPVDGQLRFQVQLQLPQGAVLNEQAPLSYQVDLISGDPVIAAAVLAERASVDPPSNDFTIALPLSETTGSARLKLSLVYYYCQQPSKSICRIGGAEWTGQIRLSASAPTSEIVLQNAAR